MNGTSLIIATIFIVCVGVVAMRQCEKNLINNERKKVCTYNYDTLNLARVLFSECDKCDFGEKLLIGSVVLNRLKDGRWGNSIHEVIHAPNQFHGTDGNWTTDSAHYVIARYLLTFGPISSVPLYFFQGRTKPFTKKLRVFYEAQYHTFAYE